MLNNPAHLPVSIFRFSFFGFDFEEFSFEGGVAAGEITGAVLIGLVLGAHAGQFRVLVVEIMHNEGFGKHGFLG